MARRPDSTARRVPAGSLLRAAGVAALLPTAAGVAVGQEPEAAARADSAAEEADSLAEHAVVGEWSVPGFEGYPWGAAPEAIPEIAGVAPRPAPSGLVAYGVPDTILGYDGFAFFLFHPESCELIEGIHLIPLERQECDAAWAVFEAYLAEGREGLRVERVKSEWSEIQQRVYDSFCDFFVFNPSETNWITRFRNPQSGLVEVGMSIRPRGLEPRLNVLWLSPAGARWEQEAVRAPAGEAEPEEPRP